MALSCISRISPSWRGTELSGAESVTQASQNSPNISTIFNGTRISASCGCPGAGEFRPQGERTRRPAERAGDWPGRGGGTGNRLGSAPRPLSADSIRSNLGTARTCPPWVQLARTPPAAAGPCRFLLRHLWRGCRYRRVRSPANRPQDGALNVLSRGSDCSPAATDRPIAATRAAAARFLITWSFLRRLSADSSRAACREGTQCHGRERAGCRIP